LDWTLGENKANSKPNKANISVQRTATRIKEREVEKTKPISCFVYRMWYIVCRVLKKQSQSSNGHNDVKSVSIIIYEDLSRRGQRKTKPIQSQFKANFIILSNTKGVEKTVPCGFLNKLDLMAGV